ncbi:hypothetical protein ABKA04_005732 [Annulohypoxylon sp. FPYF3050]
MATLSNNPTGSLQVALRNFESILSTDEKKDLRDIKAIPDADAAILFTARLDQANAKKRGVSLGSRLYSMLLSVQQFANVVGTFVSAHPEIAALVWGSVQLTMLGNPRYNKEILFTTSFETEVQSHAKILKKKTEIVQFAIRFSKAETDSKEQKLQEQERKLASNHRRIISTIMGNAEDEIRQAQEWRTQVDVVRTGEKMQRILDFISTYDPVPAYKQAQSKRHPSTGEWLTNSSELIHWKSANQSSVLFLSGKIGSGKTILASMEDEVKKLFPQVQHISVDTAPVAHDLEHYTRQCLKERWIGQAQMGDEHLLEKVCQALTKGADGMFLWVALEIEDICSQVCEEDILAALRNLPRGLTEVLDRALGRIIRQNNERIAKEVFKWLSVAARPLRLGELEDVLSIRVGDVNMMPERQIRAIERITVWCANLVEVDQISSEVQFIHHTVKQFILDTTSSTSLSHKTLSLHGSALEYENSVSELCITYLNLDDLKMTLTRVEAPSHLKLPHAIAMAASALGNAWKGPMTTPLRNGHLTLVAYGPWSAKHQTLAYSSPLLLVSEGQAHLSIGQTNFFADICVSPGKALG